MLGKTNDPNALGAAGTGLVALAPRFDQPAVIRAFDALVAVLGKTNDPNALEAVGRGLAALAPRLDQPAAIRASDALLGKTNYPNALEAVGTGLAALAPRLDQPAVIRAFDALVAVLGKTNDPNALEAVGRGLAALAPRLDQPAVIRASDALVAVLGKTNGYYALGAVGTGLAALAPRLDQPAAVRACDALVALLGKTNDSDALGAVRTGLAALAPRLDQPAAIRASDALVAVLGKIDSPNELRAAGTGLEALAPRLDQPALQLVAARAATTCAARLPGFTNSSVSELLATVLPFVAKTEHGFSEVLVAVLGALDRNEDLELQNDRRKTMRNSLEPLIFRLLRCTGNIGDVAPILTRPCCVGLTRQAVLRRLEELAFPPAPTDVTQALMLSVVSGMLESTTAAVLASVRQAKWEKERKFRTIWDAVAWLREHHPEIDLDAPYKPTR